MNQNGTNNSNYSHGLSKTRIYRTYHHMKDRCYRKTDKTYKNYGGRGITICDKWLGENGFENFYKWAFENGYEENLTIERKDVNGNYCPENCRWATRKEQANNKSTNHLLEYKGKVKNIKEWSEYFGFNYKYFHEKLKKNNWSIQKVLEIPYFKERMKCG